MRPAGAQPVSWLSLAVELQRGWARQDTVQAVIEIVLTDRPQKEQQRPLLSRSGECHA